MWCVTTTINRIMKADDIVFDGWKPAWQSIMTQEVSSIDEKEWLVCLFHRPRDIARPGGGVLKMTDRFGRVTALGHIIPSFGLFFQQAYTGFDGQRLRSENHGAASTIWRDVVRWANDRITNEMSCLETKNNLVSRNHRPSCVDTANVNVGRAEFLGIMNCRWRKCQHYPYEV